MSDQSEAPFVPPAGCWRSIGVFGDLSCPELPRVMHCRNCPVLQSAAAGLQSRPLPEGYDVFWAEQVAAPVSLPPAELSLVVFRIASDWLALESTLFVEIANPRALHRIPHREHTLVSGLANIRGQLCLCVSLAGLLELPVAGEGTGRERLAVIDQDKSSWGFRVDEVAGTVRVAESALTAPPATLPPKLASVTRGVFTWNGRRVTLLHGPNLVAALRKVVS